MTDHRRPRPPVGHTEWIDEPAASPRSTLGKTMEVVGSLMCMATPAVVVAFAFLMQETAATGVIVGMTSGAGLFLMGLWTMALGRIVDKL